MTEGDAPAGGAVAEPSTTTISALAQQQQPVTMRARKRREDAVRRLVAEVQAQETTASSVAATVNGDGGDGTVQDGGGTGADAATSSSSSTTTWMHPETHDWLVASVTAAALENGLDRELHTALVQETKDNANKIGQICQDHADVFLESVASVAALGHPAQSLSQGLQEAQDALQQETAGPMWQAAVQHSQALKSWQRAQTLSAMVEACRSTALQLEKGRKQAAAGRPRAALQAVDQARAQLARPMQALFEQQRKRQQQQQQQQIHEPGFADGEEKLNDTSFHHPRKQQQQQQQASGMGPPNLVFALHPSDAKKSLLETPFGKRASTLLPKIETEVYMGARRNLNRWFLNLRSGGDGAKAGTSVLRQCAFSLSVGPGQLSLGGQLPASYVWRAKTADNLLVRVHLTGKVARALRHGYWLERDAHAEAEKLAQLVPHEGLARKAEALAAAFGWYRCWESNELVCIDPASIVSESESSLNARGTSTSGGGTAGGDAGLSVIGEGSGGGPGGGGGGAGGGGGPNASLSGSRHGPSSKRSLGFRASTNSKSQAYADISGAALGSSAAANKRGSGTASATSGDASSQWNKALHPPILYDTAPANRKIEDNILLSLPESVHPVRRAELAFTLLGRADEFVQYYEQNRFGEIKVGGGASSGGGEDSTVPGPSSNHKGTGGGGSSTERKSYLSSLTGDDVTLGNDRIFFVKTLPHLCASVAGFSAVEAALELGNFDESEDDSDARTKTGSGGADGGDEAGGGVSGGKSAGGGTSTTGTATTGTTGTTSATTNATGATVSSSPFRESSERYERALVTELGTLSRSRASKATLVHLVQASHLLASLRASLKIVHPSSGARRYDKDLLTLGNDVFVTFMKLAQEEQLQATSSAVADDPKTPVLVTDLFSTKRGGAGLLGVSTTSSSTGAKSSGGGHSGKNVGVPDPEEVGLPFGLSNMKQRPPAADGDASSKGRYSLSVDDAYTFSSSVPVVLRLIHARAIATAAFALCQQELGQVFPEKPKGSDAAGFVLDCIEECINVAAVGMKDSHHTIDEGSVEKAVQVMANITAVQHCLPRVFATLIRGMTHVGIIKADELEETLEYAEKTLKAADKACDGQIGSTYSLVYEICRNRIDTHINFALENFNWVAKTVREKPNAYTEGLIGYLRSVFNSLGPMDEGSRAGLHFSCCGHVAERLVKLFAGKVGDTATMDNSSIAPIARIDGFGIKNLLTDCAELERFADSSGVPQLRDCFGELRTLATFLLDKELPTLVQVEQVNARRRKYPILSMEKVCNVLEKYVGTGLGDKLMGGGTNRAADMLLIDKKELPALIKVARAQQFS